MLELSRIVSRYREAQRTGEVVTLATLVAAEGSTYRRPGARLLVTGRGEVIGLLSGGCLEGDIAEHAARLTEASPARVLTYDLRGEDDVDLGLGLGCEGKLTILIERVDPREPTSPLELLACACEAGADAPAAYAVVWGGARPGRLLWSGGVRAAAGVDDPVLVAGLARDAEQAALTRRALAWAEPPALIHPLPRRLSLALFGAGPDAAPVVWQAKALGFHVTLVDHREAALERPELAACDERRAVPIARLAEEAAAIKASAALVMTHNLRADAAALEGLSRGRAEYVGLLGPRHRAARIRAELAARGALPRCLYGPTGLDIGAETPEAIALSIIAEIHAVLHGRAGASLRERLEPIHERAA